MSRSGRSIDVCGVPRYPENGFFAQRRHTDIDTGATGERFTRRSVEGSTAWSRWNRSATLFVGASGGRSVEAGDRQVAVPADIVEGSAPCL